MPVGAAGFSASTLQGLQSVLPNLRTAGQLATRHTAVTILFADVVGFTPMCSEVPPEAVMSFLNDMFSRSGPLAEPVPLLPCYFYYWPQHAHSHRSHQRERFCSCIGMDMRGHNCV